MIKHHKLLAGALAGALFATASLQGQILHTNFNGPPNVGTASLAHTDALNAANNGSRPVAFTNIPWTTGGSLGLTALTGTLTLGDYTYANLASGQMFTTLAGGAYLDPSGTGANGAARATGTTELDRANIQFGAGAVGNPNNDAVASRVGIFNLLFTVTGTFSNPELTFRAGTATTNGTWHDNTAVQQGDVEVRISPVAISGNNGVVDFSETVSIGGVQAIGAGAGPIVTASGTQTFETGTYLLQIVFSNKTRNERAAIDDLTIIPEPSTYAAIAGVLVLGLAAWRRRRKA
jgi:hypothetical protein